MILNQNLDLESIPNSVKYLFFGLNFNQRLTKGIIPNSVTHLYLGDSFNQILKKGDIPHGVIHLDLGDYFNQPLEIGIIPYTVTYLNFGYSFNQKLKEAAIHTKQSWVFNPYYPGKILLRDGRTGDFFDNKIIYMYIIVFVLRIFKNSPKYFTKGIKFLV